MTDDPKQLAEARRWLQVLADTQSREDKRIEFQGYVDAFDAALASLKNAEAAVRRAERVNDTLGEDWAHEKTRRVAAEAERDRYRKALEMVRRIARYGVGSDTTPTQALETIAVFVERPLVPPQQRRRAMPESADLIATVRERLEAANHEAELMARPDPDFVAQLKGALVALDALAAGVFLTREEAGRIERALNIGSFGQLLLAARLSEVK